MKYVIGTRGSKLALAQANWVRNRLSEAYREDSFELLTIKTKGDLILDRPLRQIGDKGAFVREIEEKLLSGEIHIAVHSMKDMPSEPAEGLMFARAWMREDPRDVLILREKKSPEELPEGAVIGTGSKRREMQLKKLWPHVRITGIRGNVETRIQKMRQEPFDGIVLAAAGLHRLGMEENITRYLEPEEMIPAPAQGVLAIEVKTGQEELLKMINALSDEETEHAVLAERGFLKEIGGSCQAPVGAFCRREENNRYRLDVMFGKEDGTKTAFATVRGEDVNRLSVSAAACIRRQIAGTVFLVGAGPGDPGLITVKGLSALRRADCVIYDRLVPFELLNETKKGCEQIYVGKECKNHTMPQEEINRLLVQKSMEHKTVVRLKGGDPYVFGRGGEEGLYLRESGVSFELVPGVSSAIAGPAYAGIPVTHRGISKGFHVVTAHEKNGESPELDFQAMADGKETCIFLMGLSKAGEIARGLLSAGMREDTKAAVISHAATHRQKTCVSDLLHLEADAAASGITSPAIIVVGDAVSLREKLNVFESRPLFGKKYLIPKIGPGKSRLGRLLEDAGASTEEIQVGEIQKIRQNFTSDQFLDVDWLIFTSRNGVEAFFYSFFSSGLDVRTLAVCKIAAIGEKTAEALQEYGLTADFVPERFCSDAFLQSFRKRLTENKNADASGGDSNALRQKAWYFKAKNADGNWRAAAEEFCDLKEVIVYENCAVKPEETARVFYEAYDGVFFTCASSAERLIEAYGKEFGSCRVYSIGPKTTERLENYGIHVAYEAKTASYESLLWTCLNAKENEA
ncbi:MAG: hydroxymethylbilane synthase [Eubacterium sp.]|jgi:uroporphyrinogen III methyltransferase/synthase|nr:hydroxymethylbilane synthase [Eubacterium sp.]